MIQTENSISVKDGSDETFMTDVIEASKEIPVIVDFWAPWCGPCKTLGPALEAAVNENQEKIKLIKIDIEKNPSMAAQMRVQSIPAVFAFSNGQPVDGFMGAQTPSQIKEFVKKIIDGFGPTDDGLKAAIKNATELLEAKDYSDAIEIFRAIILQDNTIPDAHVGLIKGLLAKKELKSAEAASEAIPSSLKSDVSIKTVIAQIQISKQTSTVASLKDLREQFTKFPEDLSVKFNLALALISDQENTEAIMTLLQILETNFGWNDGKAKSQLIELLDALGPESEVGRAGRRKLSSLIFS
jgi:putative thioredoxin